MLTLGEELLLLAVDDEKGTVLSSASMALEYGLSGAILMELTLMDKVGRDGKHLTVVDSASTEDDILDESLKAIEQSRKLRTAESWVSRLSGVVKNMKGRLLDRLIDKEILRKEEHKILWVIPTNRYPTENAGAEQETRERIRSIVLNDGAAEQALDPRMTVLISLVSACDLVNEVFSRDERKLAKKRIKEITECELLGKAVSETVSGIHAALTACVVVTSS